jgi:hypothetical protein
LHNKGLFDELIREIEVQAALAIRGLFICGFAYLRSKNCLLEEPSLQFKPYIGLFIRGFVICGPIFEERIYRE